MSAPRRLHAFFSLARSRGAATARSTALEKDEDADGVDGGFCVCKQYESFRDRIHEKIGLKRSGRFFFPSRNDLVDVLLH